MSRPETGPVDQPVPAASLGRFVPAAPDGQALVEVRLLRLPVHLLRASQEHHDGLMRELRLLALSGEVADHELPVRLVELIDVLGDRFGASRDRRDADLDAALAAGVETVDQVERIPPAAAAAAASLAEMLADADEYCRRSLLFTVPRPPLVRRFGDWYVSQFVDQVAGRDPVPWDGPLRPDR